MEAQRLRLLGLASSEEEYRTTATGVGGAKHFLFSELGRRYDLTNVFHPEPGRIVSNAAKLATWTRDKEISHRAYKRHRWVFRSKSRACEEHIRKLNEKPSLIFQWEFFFAPFDQAPRRLSPFVVYNDWTTKLSEREFPHWALPKVREHLNALQGTLMRKATYVFTFSEKVRRSVIEDYDVAPERVITTYAGVNLDVFPEPLLRRDRQDLTILFAGNDYARKGLPALIRAFRSLRPEFPDVGLVVVGDPGPTYQIRPERGVTYLGAVKDKEEIAALYRSADIFCLPTQSEAFGHVYAEAMAHSLPCIGSDVGAVGEVVLDGETGFLINPGDTEKLVEQLRLLLTAPDLRRTMAAKGYAHASKHFRWETVVDVMDPYLMQAAGLQ